MSIGMQIMGNAPHENKKSTENSMSGTSAVVSVCSILWGVVLVVVGFTKHADNFCLHYDNTVNKTIAYVDHDKALGPDGSIIEWSRQTDILLIVGTVMVFFVCEILHKREVEECKREEEESHGESGQKSRPYMAFLTIVLAAIYIVAIIVQSGRAFVIVFGKSVPLECKRGQMGDNAAWDTIYVFSVIALMVLACMGFLLVVLILLASVRYPKILVHSMKGGSTR